jgi:signal transduction histidine kinase
MMEIAIGIVGLVIGVAVGFGLGKSGAHKAGLEQGRREAGAHLGQRLKDAAAALSRGQMPQGAEKGSVEAEIFDALAAGWAPRDSERQLALRQALERVGFFLNRNVRGPLSGATAESDPTELRERMDRALGALEDLGFFLKDVATTKEGQNVGAVVQQVAKEFAQDQGIGVRMQVADRPVKAEVNTAAFMDAIYLVLHNAGRFGGGGTVDVTVAEEGGRAIVRIRDRGDGFTKEAFAQAFDPFYSTSSAGLGLGLPHARKVLEGMGGRIELRNAPDGGAEVEVSLPTT